ncbi:cupin domain-containing protein [Corynebacterium macclintockiae]|uniref:cupin domain-containing protein n=1 Tax=Corynebacterium macclintockiae TaxID=2913501 RepID=UPI003EC0727A
MLISEPEIVADASSSRLPKARLLVDASDAKGNVSVQNIQLFDGGEGAVPHYHRTSCEFFYVTKGELEFWEDGQIHQLGAGDCALVLPGVPHAFGAAKGSNADVLVTIAPGVERFEYFRILGGIMSGKVPEDELARRENEFDTYFVDAQDWRAHRGG